MPAEQAVAEPGGAPGGDPSRRTLGRPFRRLLAAATVSSVGDGLALVALPLLAATLTRSPSLVAGVLFAQRLPWLLLSLPAGALADRLPRARVMAAADLARMAILAMFGLAGLTGHFGLALLYCCAFALGSFETVFAAAAHAALPALVRGPGLDRANGYLFATQTAGEQLAGPAAGGALFAVAMAVPFLADALSFCVSGLLLFGLDRHLPAPEPVRTTSLRAEMAAGLHWFRSSPVLRLLGLVVGGLAFCQAMVMGTLVLFAMDVLHLSAAGYGLFLAAAAVGNVGGSLAATRVKASVGTAGVLTVGAVVAGAAYLVVSTTSSPVVAALMFVAESFAVGCGVVASVSLQQMVVPDELRGRVGNVVRMCIWGLIPVGALVGGMLAGTFGLRAPFAVAGTVQGVLALATAARLKRLVDGAEHPKPRAEELHG